MKLSVYFENLKGTCLHSKDWATESRVDSDYWRVFLDTGENRELAVYSHEQHYANVVQEQGRVVRRYDRLIAEDGQIFDIRLELVIT